MKRCADVTHLIGDVIRIYEYFKILASLRPKVGNLPMSQVCSVCIMSSINARSAVRALWFSLTLFIAQYVCRAKRDLPVVPGSEATQCDQICSSKDIYTGVIWERISEDHVVPGAKGLETLAGYYNHSFVHLPNWQPHFCSRRKVGTD